MKHLTALLFSSLLLISPALVKAQPIDPSVDPMTAHRIGFSASSLTGMSFSYRYIKGMHGFQVNAMPIYMSLHFQEYYGSMGISSIHMLRKAKTSLFLQPTVGVMSYGNRVYTGGLELGLLSMDAGPIEGDIRAGLGYYRPADGYAFLAPSLSMSLHYRL